ncbi:MAG: trypsin-like peptidase domain-containing protein, partial [Pirellulales bacterium]
MASALSAVAHEAAASERRQTATVKLVQHASPAIVNIHGQKTLAPGDENYRRGELQNVNGMGTGVIIDERGYILTNHHVVEGVKRIEVTLSDDEEYVATRVTHDPKTDLAIIKINANTKLPVIDIGTSSDLMTGEEVVAVGNAYGYEHTVTRGIISALHRTVQVSETQSYKDLIQTDASINPGNSGGPLLNIDGEMIGINVAVRAGAQGIGFAIPVDMAVEVAAELMCAERERAENTWHGIVAKAPVQPSASSCVVGPLDEKSPAAKCGLKPGDVIARIGDNPVARSLDLERALL